MYNYLVYFMILFNYAKVEDSEILYEKGIVLEKIHSPYGVENVRYVVRKNIPIN